MSRQSSHFTAKNWPINEAPARVTLFGDKHQKNEPAQHIIEFPGGAIELTRTSDDEYWAHIIVNREAAINFGSTRQSATGSVVACRIDTPEKIADVPYSDSLTQIALLIRPNGGAR